MFQKIFKWNNAHNPGAEYQITELELPSGTQRPLRHSNSPQGTAKNFGADITHGLENVSWGNCMASLCARMLIIYPSDTCF